MKELFIAILMIGAIALLVNISQGAVKRHPSLMPVTLLDLYRQSDVVTEARFDRVEEGDTVRQDQDYSVVKVKKLFDVSSTLKGSYYKFVSLSEDEYRYPAPQQTPSYLIARAGGAGDEQTYGLRSGDTVLLFLKYGEDGKTLELTDDEEGLKKLSSNDIAVYEKRMRELDGLISGDTPSADAIVEWMMHCAEEPATRWEATFELVKGFERLDFQKKHKQPESDPVKNAFAEKPDFFDSTTFAKAVTDDQKHKLADILLSRPQTQIGENGVAKHIYVKGDRELIDLVKQWGDPRLAGFLINELKTKELTDYRRSETMHLIAGILGDPKITGLAERYSSSYRNESLAEQLFAEQTPSAAGDPATPGNEYQQARTALMTRFIKLASSAIE